MNSAILTNVVSLLLALDFVSLVFIAWRGRRFLKATPFITNREEFEAYRQLVASCMKATFGFVCLFMGALLVSYVGLQFGWIRFGDLQTVATMGAIRVTGAAFMTLNVEGNLKAISTTAEWTKSKNEIVRLWDWEPWPRKVYQVSQSDPASEEKTASVG